MYYALRASPFTSQPPSVSPAHIISPVSNQFVDFFSLSSSLCSVHGSCRHTPTHDLFLSTPFPSTVQCTSPHLILLSRVSARLRLALAFARNEVMIAVIGRFSSAACFPTIFSFFPRWPVFSSPSLSPLSFLCSVLFWLFFLVHLLFRRIYESFLCFPQSAIVIRQSTRIFHIIYHIIPYNSIHPSLCPFTAHHRFCSALLIGVAPSSVFVFVFVCL